MGKCGVLPVASTMSSSNNCKEFLGKQGEWFMNGLKGPYLFEGVIVQMTF